MTIREKALRVIEALPEDATLDQIVESLRHLAPEAAADLDPPLPKGGAWDLLEQVAGTVDMPADWAAEHDHHLYDTPKRSG